MRTRAIFTALLLATACVAPAVGCQIIAGITSLEVGTGGSSSSTGGLPSCMPGMPCGDVCLGNAQVAAATCDDAGACPGQVTPCQGPNNLCLQPPSVAPMCAPCGTFPNMDTSVCAAPDCASCDDGGTTCVTSCDGPGSCPAGGSPHILDATKSKATFQCNGMGVCDQLVVECQGPFPCELVCDGGCLGTTLKCSGTGPCKLTCAAKSCMNAKVECGNNTCVASCAEAATITQECNGACSCTKHDPGSSCQ
jgi:hypothetical protein